MYRNNFIIRLEIDYNPISRLNYFKYFQRVPNIYLILSLQHLSSLCNSIFPGNGRKRCIILQVDLSSTTTTTFSFFFSLRHGISETPPPWRAHHRGYLWGYFGARERVLTHYKLRTCPPLPLLFLLLSSPLLSSSSLNANFRTALQHHVSSKVKYSGEICIVIESSELLKGKLDGYR